jgi:hypothetical protein
MAVNRIDLERDGFSVGGTQLVAQNGGVTVGNNLSVLADAFTAGNLTVFKTLALNTVTERVSVLAAPAQAVINYDISLQSVLYYTANAQGNWTVNLRGAPSTTLNSFLTTGQCLTVALLATQGTTAYYNTQVQVDGTAITARWQGGSAPASGNASGVDMYSYTVIKTANAAFAVFASLTRFA